MERKKERPRRPGGRANGTAIALPAKPRNILCTDVQNVAQPVLLGSRYIGWGIDHPNGQVEATAALYGSLGWFNDGQAALNALIEHEERHG